MLKYRTNKTELSSVPHMSLVKINKYLNHSSPNTKTYISLSIHLSRRQRKTNILIAFYVFFKVYVPCILIVVLSWVGFWIHREATSDRVGLGITTVLTLSTIRYVFYSFTARLFAFIPI